MNARKTMVVIVTAFACALMAMAALTGCAGGGTLSGETLEETGAYKVTADNADNSSAVGATDAVVLTEGDLLLVSPDLTKGKLQVTLTDANGANAFDEEVSGRILDTYEVDPGSYSLMVTCTEAGTTGTLVVSAVNAAEFDVQNQGLDAALATAAGNETAKEVEAAIGAEPSYEIDYGQSSIYSQDDIDGAIRTVMAEFGTWKGCTMTSIAFTDDATCESDVKYVNELRDSSEPEFDQAIVLTSNFHSPSEADAKDTAWEPDTDYEGWTWHLGRTDEGEWKLMTWGYA